MLALFGLPHLPRVLEAYEEVSPLAEGWEERVALHQLFPLLVHACLFGGGYGARAAEAAARYRLSSPVRAASQDQPPHSGRSAGRARCARVLPGAPRRWRGTRTGAVGDEHRDAHRPRLGEGHVGVGQVASSSSPSPSRSHR